MTTPCGEFRTEICHDGRDDIQANIATIGVAMITSAMMMNVTFRMAQLQEIELSHRTVESSRPEQRSEEGTNLQRVGCNNLLARC